MDWKQGIESVFELHGQRNLLPVNIEDGYALRQALCELIETRYDEGMDAVELEPAEFTQAELVKVPRRVDPRSPAPRRPMMFT